MQETELKFLVPTSQLQRLIHQMHIEPSQKTTLAAHYYDTPDRQLATAGIGLRIRKEDDTWVQTIKAGGDGLATRLEHNAILDETQVQTMLSAGALMPDLTIYTDTPIASVLAGFDQHALATALTLQYVTEVQRTTRLLVTDDSLGAENRVEIAYDEGQILHGTDDTLQTGIQEIEFELVSGTSDFLFNTAATWCRRYQLCLSTVTKAERGSLLIQGQDHSPAVSTGASPQNVDESTKMPAFIRALVHHCLRQILPNSSAIVAGSTDHLPILRLQIGMERLRVALEAFAKYSAHINLDWQPILKQTTALLDQYQQSAYLASHIEPHLQKHGGPSVDWKAEIEACKIKPIDAVSANDFQLMLLELMAFAMSDTAYEPQADQRAIEAITNTLSKRQQALRNTYKKSAKTCSIRRDDTESNTPPNDDKPASERWDAQLTDLRYLTELSVPVWYNTLPKKRSQRQLKRLIKAQKLLKKHRSHSQYQRSYQQKSTTDTKALYGAGWLAATLKKDRQRLTKHMRRLQDTLC